MLLFAAFLAWPGKRLTAQFQSGLDVDSLRTVLASLDDDTTKAKTLITLGQQYENNLPDSAIYFYKQAGELSERLGDVSGVVRYINNYTAVLNMQGKFDQSLKLNMQAVELCEEHGLNDLLMLAQSNVGTVYQQKEDYAQALDWYLKVLPAIELTDDANRQSFYYGNLCGLYRSLNQLEKALLYARKSLDAAERTGENFAVGSACINLANVLKDGGKIDEAIPFLQRARQLGEATNDMYILETALINLGDSYLKSNQPEQYLPLYEEALPLAEAIDDVSGQAYARLGIAMGLFWTKQYEKAKTYLAPSILFAKEHDQKEPLSRMFLLMSEVQIALGAPHQAAPYWHQYDSLNSLLAGIELQQHIQELETKYGTERQRRELLQQRQWLLISVAAVLVLVLLLALSYYAYKQRQKLNAKALQAVKAEQETLQLKAKLQGEQLERRRISQEMHDDMGAGLTRMLYLSRSLSEQDETSAKIRDAAQGLVKKMSEIIWTMNDEDATLDNLVAYIHTATSELLDNTGIDYRFAVVEPLPAISLSQEYRRNIFLVVKEATHNVVKHAAATSVDVIVHIDACLHITVRDNGKGIDLVAEKRFGNGLRNMRQRIEKINGSVEISSDKGTRIAIRVPIPL